MDSLGWGLILWLVRDVLGVVLTTVAPAAPIGWVIVPVAGAFSLWVAFTRLKGETLSDYAVVAIAWTTVAMLCDYLFVVKGPVEAYYHADVRLYYALTFIIPVCAGSVKEPHGERSWA